MAGERPTIRGEFATRELQLGGTYNQEESISATSCEEVLAFQTSDLEELTLFGMEDIRSSSLNKLSGLRALRLVDSVLVDDRSEIVVDFCLRELVVEGSSLPSRYLLFIVESSSASITKLDLRLGPGFDWSPLTSLSSLAFPQLEDLTVVGVDTPPPAFLSRCGTLKRLALFRITSNVLDPLAQIRQELSPLPNPTLVEMTLGLRNVPRNTGVVTQEDVEKMIEIPSLANLECLMLFLACSMDGALIDAVTGIKGKKGKLVVTVDVF